MTTATGEGGLTVSMTTKNWERKAFKTGAEALDFIEECALDPNEPEVYELNGQKIFGEEPQLFVYISEGSND